MTSVLQFGLAMGFHTVVAVWHLFTKPRKYNVPLLLQTFYRQKVDAIQCLSLHTESIEATISDHRLPQDTMWCRRHVWTQTAAFIFVVAAALTAWNIDYESASIC
mmetsp:Transcript_25557/g.60443  ORF Transcript_25557/g.60443 Transcript_25557/m.60443 type:complete len:105 (+) Transcript_25557:161-475(+)